MLNIISVCCLVLLVGQHACATDVNINSLQVFAIPIVPQYFNWTSDERRNEYRYEASLLDSPDLPSWIHYIYSERTHRGYLYGVAPKDQKNFKLEIIALNKKTYETREKTLEVIVSESDVVSKYQIQLKVNSWNVEEMFDLNRTEMLFDIFRQNIWKNATDLQLTFLAPAVELGARYPLKPGEGVGTVLRIGSSTQFSSDLQNLEKELEPIIRKFSSCNFKKIDDLSERRDEDSEGRDDDTSASTIGSAPASKDQQQQPSAASEWRWLVDKKSALPQRNYRREIFTSVFVPALMLLLLVGFLSAILCLQHDDLITSNGKRGSPLLLDNGNRGNGVQMIQYATMGSNRAGTLRSLPNNQVSCSPTTSDSRLISRSPRDHSNNYVRPKPPPYISSNSFGMSPRADI
uniref:Epsilon-sarcoglycan n=1 Tax=Trichogramma kaykai TaxID=54128 RepID=A0ABD2X162_9HYME